MTEKSGPGIDTSQVRAPSPAQPSDARSLYEAIGRDHVNVGDLPDLQIQFLEELCRLWPYSLDRYYATRDYVGAEQENLLAKIGEQERPIREKAGLLLRVLWFVRTQYEIAIVDAGKAGQDKVRARCKRDPAFFINNFCAIQEPRMPEIGLSADLPFIMYPKQQQIIEEIELAYRNRQDILVEKSREAGVTWGVIALLLHHFIFMRGFSAIVGSEKEEKVDFLGSKKPLFGKLRYLMYHLPMFLRPKTFEHENGENDNFRRFANPENGAEITGEAGVNIGRSGRASMVVIDECQAIEQPEKVDSALESVVNCRVDIGTPLGMNHFGQKRHSGKVRVATIEWWKDPRKNPEWRTGLKNLDCAWRMLLEEKRSAVTIAQEHDLDYRASVEGLFIPSKWIMAAVDFQIPAEGEKVGGFDPAGRGPNESVYVSRTGPVLHTPKVLPYDTPTDAMWAAFDEAENDGLEALNYDIGGIGESIWGQVKNSTRKLLFRLRAIDSSLPASKERFLEDEGKFANEKFMNKRSEMWWNLRTRFKKAYEHRQGKRFYAPGEMISIPNRPTLIDQLSSPKEVRSAGGKIGVESKKDMKARGVKSPDEGDATAYAFDDYYESENVIDQFNPTDSSTHFTDFTIDHIRAIGDSYAVIFQDKDMTSYVLCCLWRGMGAGLQVYGEAVLENATPDDVIGFVNKTMEPGVKHLREWIANDEMFTGVEQGRHAPWRLYRKNGVRLKRNYLDDERGSKMLTNQMFKHNLIQIHRNCTRLFAQLQNWKKGTIDFGLPRALCLIVTRLRKLRQLYIEELMPGQYGRPPRSQRRVA